MVQKGRATNFGTGRVKAGLLVALVVASSGCSTVSYYTQAVVGQMSLLAKRRPIERVIEDPETPADVRAKLSLAREITRFARTELHLPVDGSYSSYADIGRSSVVWNVFAAPEFSLEPESFCYPIAGCVSYRGFFAETAARDFARSLQEDGLDVYVGGVAAYSTLGWFNDPILNTFVTRSDARLAALLFHELAHKVVYIPGDTAFNEGFATTVEHHGLERWLIRRDMPEVYEAWLLQERSDQAVIELIGKTRLALEAIYASDRSTDDMRAEKASAIEELRQGFEELKSEGGDYSRFERWINADINNAKLGTIATYNDWVPAFSRMFADLEYDFARLNARVRELAKLDKSDRDRALSELVP